VVLASYFLVLTLYIITEQKKYDIAVLKTIGMSQLSIKFIFILIGIAYGFFGIILGVFGGYFVSLFFSNKLNILVKELIGLSVFEPALEINTIVQIILICSALIFFGSIIPAIIASNTKPIQALREK
jgi:lipoprotein-releasing system permease protein